MTEKLRSTVTVGLHPPAFVTEKGVHMAKYRIKGSTLIINASSMKQAIKKLVAPDGDFKYSIHFYTKTVKSSWADVETSYGYRCIVEQI